MEAKKEMTELPTQAELTDPFITYGTAKKAPWDMTLEEWAVAAEELRVQVRKNAFAHNLPVCFERDGYVCTEYPNGTIVKLKPVEFCLNK